MSNSHNGTGSVPVRAAARLQTTTTSSGQVPPAWPAWMQWPAWAYIPVDQLDLDAFDARGYLRSPGEGRDHDGTQAQ